MDVKKPPFIKCQIEILREVKKDGKPCRDPRILKLLEEFSDIFAEELPGLPPKREFQHESKLKGSLPKSRPIYCLTPKEDDALRDHLKDSLGKGLIRSSKALYSVGVFFVAKKTGGLRLVTDYRALNKVTVRN